MTTLLAVRRELGAITDRDIATGVEANQALAMARIVDDPEAPAAARATANRELRDTLAALRKLAPTQKSDWLDDLSARRTSRRRRTAS